MKHVDMTPSPNDKVNRKKLFTGLFFLFIAVVATILILVLPDSTQTKLDSETPPLFTKDGIAYFYDLSGNQICSFDIEIAASPEKMKTGLMYRDSLAANQAMLFIYEKPDILSFWMKNTYLPLDIVFIGSDSTIVSVGENTTPFSEQSVVSKGPSQFVLEINAGLAKKLKLDIGSKFKWIGNR